MYMWVQRIFQLSCMVLYSENNLGAYLPKFRSYILYISEFQWSCRLLFLFYFWKIWNVRASTSLHKLKIQFIRYLEKSLGNRRLAVRQAQRRPSTPCSGPARWAPSSRPAGRHDRQATGAGDRDGSSAASTVTVGRTTPTPANITRRQLPSYRRRRSTNWDTWPCMFVQPRPEHVVHVAGLFSLRFFYFRIFKKSCWMI
jgi:hypothetical protein